MVKSFSLEYANQLMDKEQRVLILLGYVGGGYKIAQITSTSGGERDLFDQRRRKPAEFVRWVNIILSAKRL